MEDEGIKKLYSKALRELVMECMLQEPLARPSTAELVKRTKEGRDSAVDLTKTLSEEQTWEKGWADLPMIAADHFPESPTILKGPIYNTPFRAPDPTPKPTPIPTPDNRSPNRSSKPGSGFGSGFKSRSTAVGSLPSDMAVNVLLRVPARADSI